MFATASSMYASYNQFPDTDHTLFMDNINNQMNKLASVDPKVNVLKLNDPKLSLQHSLDDSLPSSPQDRRSISSSASSLKSSASSFTPTSNYWHVTPPPDPLTALSVRDDRLCALGSSGLVDNLLIYEAFSDSVTHHQSITLPEIYSLKWVDRQSNLGQLGNVLISGHRNGTVHMTLLPDSNANVQQGSAEILKRYNHAKHLPKDMNIRSTRIRDLDLTNSNWNCCPQQSLFTLCGDHIFLWEPNRSDVPLVVQKTRGTNTFDLCPERDGIYAVGRHRGVCIRDIRVRDRVNSGLKPVIGNDERVTMVKWNPYDDGNKFAAVHDRTTVKLWDIRNGQPVGTYKGHADEITSLEWSSDCEFVTSSLDGTIRINDVFADSEPAVPTKPGSAHGANSPSDSMDFDFGEPEIVNSWSQYSQRRTMNNSLDKFAQNLLVNPPPVTQKRGFTGMQLADMGPCLEAITIDNGGFLGIHELQ